MPLAAGDKLGPYEILSPLGAGGMGEVYKARDTRLGRDVAIKISNEKFSDRFEREAKSIAALNHPNICQLYDVGPDYLVMELIDGESPRGPLALVTALNYSRHIADALDAAHEKGIVHRDLKPANIKITSLGVVKVLDFGLAKITDPAAADPENSPTITVSPTKAGMILGTAAYMSPEQARGKPVDKRADIWAFGVVLYELLAGERPFRGDTVTDTIASVLKSDPDYTRVPLRVHRLLKACLEKDPQKRLRDIGDAWRVPTVVEAAKAPPPRRWIVAALAAMLILGAVATIALFRPAPPATSYRLSIAPPPGGRFEFTTNIGGSAISPDGRMLAFVSDRSLWVRSLDSDTAQRLPGTENAYLPFWSPDQHSIGFFGVRTLKRINLPSGPVIELAHLDRNARGGAWNKQGIILFSQNTQPILQIPSGGGTAAPATQLIGDEFDHSPSFLPGGERFLYLGRSLDPSRNGVFVGSLKDPKLHARVLDLFSNAIYLPNPEGPGYLFFARQNALFAQPFDPRKLAFTGDPLHVAPSVGFQNPTGLANFSVSETGTVVIGDAGEPKVHMTWCDRRGNVLSTPGPTDYLSDSSRLSPDGSRIAVPKRQPNGFDSMWLFDFDRGTMSHVDDDGARPAWSADGKTLLYDHHREQAYIKRSLDSGAIELAAKIDSIPGNAIDWSPDGKYLAIPDKLALLPLFDPNPSDHPIRIGSGFFPRFSPDGNWIAYASNEGARFDVVVQRVPDGRSRVTVSTDGGWMPRWRKDGKELFYTNAKGDVWAVDVTPSGASLAFGRPHLLFTVPGQTTFDVSPDGQRILSFRALQTATADDQLTILLNWREGVQK